MKLIKNTQWKEVEINGEMQEIPKLWNVDSLNNLCDVRDGTHESPKFVEKGIPFITTKNLINGQIDFSSAKFISEKDHEDYSRRSKVDNGDILLGMIGTVGNPIIVKNKPFDFSIKNLGLIKTKNKINQSFLFFEFNKTIEEQKLKADGGVLKFMTLGVLRNIQIYYPSESQQSSIASILSAQESIISDIESLISKYESRFQYLSEELLSGRLRVKEVDGQTVLYKNPEDNWKEVEINGELKEIPKDWDVDKIINVADFKNGYAFHRQDINDHKTSYKLIKIGNILLNKQYCNESNNQAYLKNPNDNFELFNNDLIIAMDDLTPDISFIGTTTIIKNEIDRIFQNQRLGLLSPFKINKKYLNLQINNNQYHFAKIATGSTAKNLSKSLIENFMVSMPNKNEQCSIATILSQQESLIEDQKNLLEKEKQKFDWLLENLLSGRYLVKDLDDF